MKSYYTTASVGIPGQHSSSNYVPVEFDFEIQAMATSASVNLNGVSGSMNGAANNLNIKTSVNFNFKRANNEEKSGNKRGGSPS